jgi:hypothetical protein
MMTKLTFPKTRRNNLSNKPLMTAVIAKAVFAHAANVKTDVETDIRLGH